MEVDAQTVALYEFQADSVQTGKLSDRSGRSTSGVIHGKWTLESPEQVRPNYSVVGRMPALRESEKEAAFLEFPGLSALSQGAFSIDTVLRWGKGKADGFFLKIGKEPQALAMGVLHRGPGIFQLRVPVRSAKGQVKLETLESLEIYKEVGPLRGDEFYMYSLTYDGKETFRLYINGNKAFEAKIPAGTVFQGSDDLSIGTVAKWKSLFRNGDIAAIRISKGERCYPALKNDIVSFNRAAQSGWTFDAGTATSPVERGAISLTKADLYEAKKGYGWLGTPLGDFDEWYVAGRYAATPQLAYPKGEHKILDALQRDGIVMSEGDLFRADIPDGRYWVGLELGHNRDRCQIASISANGQVLGQNLRTNANLNDNAIVGRSVRGLVTVANGKGLTISAKSKSNGEAISIKSIEIVSYAPLPVALKGRQLEWRGAGGEASKIKPISEALARDDRKAAIDEAKKIKDELIQANILACILGQPKLPDDEDLEIAFQIRDLLTSVLRAQPGNQEARWLFDSTERFRHALNGYLNDSGDEVVYGSRFGVQAQTVNIAQTLKPEDPEYWQARFIAAASIWQLATQASTLPEPPNTSDRFLYPERIQAFDPSGNDFREIIVAYPDFRIARIMLGELLPIKSTWQAPENAPQWASLQYQLLQRILDVLHYWTDQRADDRGLLGGGIGDDCEALRWWGPAITLTRDERAVNVWQRMADTAWKMTNGKGYWTAMDDVEHSAEPTADTLSMLGLIDFDTERMPQTHQRLTATLPIFRDIWTFINPEGCRMFKGHFMNATAIDREGDVPYNLRAIRPLIWGAWISAEKNSELNSLIVSYAKNWRDAIMTEFDGKPRGIVPMMIMPDRKTSHETRGKSWESPGYSTYEYPEGYSGKAYELLMAGYELSGDKSFLEPIQFAMFELRKIPAGDEKAEKYGKGTYEWALRSFIPAIGAAGGNYRFITGDHSYDDVLERFGPPVTRFHILREKAENSAAYSAAISEIIEKLQSDLKAMSHNPEALTVMVQSTDRIYVTGSQILNAMATGMAFPVTDLRGGEIIWPLFQVTWGGTDSEVAALVQRASPTELEVLLYNFGSGTKHVIPRIWRLKPGTYSLTVIETDKDGFKNLKELEKREVKIDRVGCEVKFDLPVRFPVKMRLIHQ